MTKHRNAFAMAVVLALLAPSLLAGVQATGHDRVRFTTGDVTVDWQPVRDLTTRLYFTPPAANDPGTAGGMTTLPPEATSADGAGDETSRMYGGSTTLGTVFASQAVFKFTTKYDFNLTNNNSVTVQWYGLWDEDAQFTATLKSTKDGTYGRAIADLKHGDLPTDPDRARVVIKPLEEHNGRFHVEAGTELILEIQRTGGDGVGQWRLDFGNPARPSFLELRTHDAVKTAAWTVDKDKEVRDFFRPDRRNLTTGPVENRMDMYFAVRSAFGGEDLKGNRDYHRPFEPRIQVFRNGEAYGLGDERLDRVDLVPAPETSQERGVMVYHLPPDSGLWDYRYAESGEYELKGSVELRPDDPAQGGTVSAIWPFVVSLQKLSLRLYDDDDATTQPFPLESSNHELAAGSSTAWAVLVKNGGDVNDTVTVNARVVSAEPAGLSWRVRVLGDNVVGGEKIKLGPQEERLFMVRLEAPEGAPLDAKAIVEVSAESGLDETAKTDPFALIATVTDRVKREAGVIVPAEPVDVRPLKDTPAQVYAWNRGTRTANVSLELRLDENSAWTPFFKNAAGGEVRTVTVEGLAPGEFVPVTLYMRAALDLRPDVTYNATLAPVLPDAPNAEKTEQLKRDVIFRVKPIGGFSLEILEGISGDRTLELDSTSAVNGETADGPQGQWVRVWLTNNGDRTDHYKVNLVQSGTNLGIKPTSDPTPRPDGSHCPSFGPNPKDPSCDGSATSTASWNPSGLYYRSQDGRASPIPSHRVENVKPGETVEFYVWIANNPDLSPSKFTFAIAAESENTGEFHTLTESITSRNHDPDDGPSRKSDALLEPVRRIENYDTFHLVDVRHKDHEEGEPIIGGVAIGGNYTFAVRVTHGFDWRTHDGKRAEIPLDFIGVNAQEGWNVSMRRVGEEVEFGKDPWKRTLTLTNERANGGEDKRYQSYYDEEILIRVQPPGANATKQVTAGAVDEFMLIAGTQRNILANLPFRIYVAPEPNVTMEAERALEFVHPGEETAFAVKVENNGSVATDATLITRVTEGSNNAAAWNVVEGSQIMSLAPYTNQSIGVRVTAPAGAAPGDRAILNVTLEYLTNPEDETSVKRTWLELTAEVRDQGDLRLTSDTPTVNAEPGGVASFLFTVTNTGQDDNLRFRAESSPLANWTGKPSVETSDTLASGDSTNFALILRVPTDIIRGSSYTTVVRVFAVDESGNEARDNFDLVPVTVNIVEGRAVPQVRIEQTEGIVDRGGAQRFLVGITNVGNANGTFPLGIDIGTPYREAGWRAWIEDSTGANITQIDLQPREHVNVNLTVVAPRTVPESTKVPVTLSAYQSESRLRASSDEVMVNIHDYGLDVQLDPARKNIIPGGAAEFTVRLTNLGNGADTLRLDADKQGLDTWTLEFSRQSIRLDPGASAELSLITRTPKEPLPAPRQYTMSVLGSSDGGANVGVYRNDSAPYTVTVLDYRPFDADGDGVLEVAIDENQRASDGYEEFREVFTTQGVTSEVLDTVDKPDTKTGFLLDVPQGETTSYDGLADVYFDPDLLFAYSIQHTPDVNGDASPDYLLDTDNDGLIDSLWDPASRSMSRVTVIRAYGDTTEQYLVDLDNDGTPDKYYDPEEDLVTRTTQGKDGTIGIDTNDDGRPNKYYDAKSGTVTGASVSNLTDFARQYWPFFAMFVLVILVFAAVLVRRRN